MRAPRGLFSRQGRRRAGIHTVCLVLICLGLAAPQAMAIDGGPEDATLAAMFRHGLAEPAIEYCRRRRALHAQQPSLYARWTMRLMECHAQAGLASGNDSPHWNRCSEIHEEFSTAQASHVRLPWLDWQLTRCQLLQGQALLSEHLAAPANQQSREAALQVVRDILRRSSDLEDDIQRRQPIAARQGLNGTQEAPADQLERLRVDVGLLRCEALLIRAKLYASGSKDRIAAATDVESTADKILGITGSEWGTRIPLEVARASARLELGRSEEGLKTLLTIAGDDSPSPVGAVAAARAIEHLVDQGQVSRAQGVLPMLAANSRGPLLELAQLQVAIGDLSRIRDEAVRVSRMQDLLKQIKNVGQVHGGYWRNRAEALLVASGNAGQTSQGGSAQLELVMVKVRQLIAAEQNSQAIDELVQFATDAVAAAQPDLAMQAVRRAGVILLRLEDEPELAASTLQDMSQQFPQLEPAALAHQEAILAWQEAVRRDSGNTKLLAAYEAAMRAHLKLWPTHTSTKTVQAWLRLWLSGQGRHSEFAQALLDQILANPEGSVSTNMASNWLASLMKVDDAAAQVQLISTLQRAREGMDSERATRVHCLELAARTLTSWPNIDEQRQINRQASLLNASLGGDAGFAASCLNITRALTAVRGGQISEVRRMEIDWDAELFSNVQLASEVSQQFIAAVDFDTRYSPQGWSDALGWDSDFAQRLLDQEPAFAGWRINHWLGDDASLSSLQQYVDEHPRNAAAQLQLAAAMAAPDTRGEYSEEQLAQSTRIARRVAANSQPATDVNWHARWRVLRNRELQSGSAEAAVLAQRFLATNPVSSEVWASRFKRFVEETQ